MMSVYSLQHWLSALVQVWDTFMDYIEPYSSRAPYMIAIGAPAAIIVHAIMLLRPVHDSMRNLLYLVLYPVSACKLQHGICTIHV